jgi:hypothetical protein
MKSLYVALLHHPVTDRNGQIITSSVTNMDLHDIARSCRTFGVRHYFVVHPSADEQALNRRILSHWFSGYGELSHPTRKDALGLVQLVHRYEEVIERIESLEGEKPLVVGTSARREGPRRLSLSDLTQKLETTPVLLVFGTGYGLAASWHERLDGYLGPIEGPTDFNHLSVRSAVAIYLDRLRGQNRQA